MQACYICQNYQWTSDDDLPVCRRIQNKPITVEKAKTSSSLKLLRCHNSGESRGAYFTFRRVVFPLPTDIKADSVYVCCPEFYDLLRAKDPVIVTFKRADFAVRYLIADIPARFCPFCGSKLRLRSEVDRHVAMMNEARASRGKRGSRNLLSGGKRKKEEKTEN